MRDLLRGCTICLLPPDVRNNECMAVRAHGHVYLFEFKMAEMAPPGSALDQLQEWDHAAKYRGSGEPIHLVGVEFSRTTRNITAFETADA